MIIERVFVIVDVWEASDLHRVLDELAVVDPAGLPDGSLHDEVIGLLAARTRLEGLLHRLIGVWDGRGVWSGDGSKSRAIRLRDRGCTHPAICDAPADRCDIDHITPWAVGGTTTIDNGRLLCRRHNRNIDLRNRQPNTARITTVPRGWIPALARNRTDDDRDPDDPDDGRRH